MYNRWVNHFKCPGKTDAQDAPRTNSTEWGPGGASGSNRC